MIGMHCIYNSVEKNWSFEKAYSDGYVRYYYTKIDVKDFVSNIAPKNVKFYFYKT